jgi:hypothetical protein
VRHRLFATDASRHVNELLAQQRMVGFGHAEKISDHEQRERLRKRTDELAVAGGEELVELAVAQPPHEVFVLLEALRCDQPQQQTAVCCVLRRVERGELVTERQFIAVRVDHVGDVVALDRHRELHERTAHRVARREGGVVAVHTYGFVYPVTMNTPWCGSCTTGQVSRSCSK